VQVLTLNIASTTEAVNINFKKNSHSQTEVYSNFN